MPDSYFEALEVRGLPESPSKSFIDSNLNVMALFKKQIEDEKLRQCC